ncbi:BUD22 [Geosmithia morbida]|uniref:BUD22 n=1 Tax=Geosmithia morbida TaxID=1094350 RepID=A0A9P5D1G2_9HYPO|nr:BUD22 [Geosmithia morbida]KAF4122717.1 BUD22 [Geosmithia morbida]
MPKRKRSEEQTLSDKLEKYYDEVFRALKTAKGFERQRLSKRQREKGVTPDKLQRLEREVTVLKSLDLHQTARAHLASSLLKVKSIASSPELPDQIRNGVSKPELPEEERVALHNVTSGLYNRKQVRDAVDRAIKVACTHLKVDPPGKGKKNARDVDEKKKEEVEKESKDGEEQEKPKRIPVRSKKQVSGEEEEETDFDGFDDGHEQADEEELGSDQEEARVSTYDALLGSSSDEDSGDDADLSRYEKFRGTEKVNLDDISGSESEDGDESEDGEEDSELEEARISKYDTLLGDSDGSDDDDDLSRYEKFRGTEKVNLDDISSISGSGSGSEADASDDDGSDSDEDNDDVGSAPPAASPSPPPSPPPAKKTKKSNKVTATPRDTTFLPSLMGGYVSGSESASDVDVVAPKKRRGQRARQAIWEKKYGASARHLAQQKKKGQKGRDAGWDARRGAVDPADAGNRTPWKKGVVNPFSSGKGGHDKRPPPPPTKKDDEGPLHPSWEARKKKAESLKSVAFTGQKLVFD